MSGVTKHIYEHELQDMKKMWNKQISEITSILPKEYDEQEIVRIVKEFYPYEWEKAEIMHDYYVIKDKSIKKRLGKKRYDIPDVMIIFKSTGCYKKIMDPTFQKKYKEEFDDETYLINRLVLKEKRITKINRITEKIERAKSKTQQVTPDFLDQLTGLYDRKNTSQKDKVYILAELKKYYSPKIIKFFYKVNDTEINRQLREEAFYHLQSFNYNPRLRAQQYMQVHKKNKKRKKEMKQIYAFETYKIPHNPDELEYRINNAKEQKLKRYDYFISHSSKDSASVQKLISYENSNNKNIYCDWIDDADYLKRELICKATLKVIENRLEISDAIIYVMSLNAKESVWCKYELNYFARLGKTIFYIEKEKIDSETWNLKEMPKELYWDDNYLSINLSIPQKG